MKQLLNIFNICVIVSSQFLSPSELAALTKEEISKIIISESYKSKSVKPEIALEVAEIGQAFALT